MKHETSGYKKNNFAICCSGVKRGILLCEVDINDISQKVTCSGKYLGIRGLMFRE
jgi:hypothetical protein